MRRTYLRRRGRMTRGQSLALETLSGTYIVAPEPSGWPQVFYRAAPLGVEIGFGMGQTLLDWATTHPHLNLIGIEIYEPGIGALLAGIERRGLTNLRVLRGDAEELLDVGFHPASLAEIHIWFPDPWPKKRHHKRRLIQPKFTALLANRLAPGGTLSIATDWAPYAQWIAAVLRAEPALQAGAAASERLETRFEARGRRLGHEIFEFHLGRCDGGSI